MIHSRDKLWLFVGVILCLGSVALGAFGAHGLKSDLEAQGLSDYELDRKLANWETAARYQMYHGLALLAVGLLAARQCGWEINLAGGAMTLGTLIFSGCLYVLVLTGITFLGRIVPIGGGLMIVGWICLAVAVVNLPPRESASRKP
ncbi:MAG: DUF423 domain-containing protein [Pirellulaceae bacterium]|jgi:uncharacterized membrane protein YgdD (TMEM256/DUF423 family)|nr:DUF423 domain-containing protein [Pirellulaceae bacterium]